MPPAWATSGVAKIRGFSSPSVPVRVNYMVSAFNVSAVGAGSELSHWLRVRVHANPKGVIDASQSAFDVLQMTAASSMEKRLCSESSVALIPFGRTI